MSGRSVGETAARVRTGVSERDTRNRRKALVFFRRADTVEWIAGRSGERIDADPRPVPPAEAASPPGGARIRYREAGRADAAFGFASESTEAPPGKATDAYDVPVATDALAEGMNLQQCGRIADHDLPWNPARAGPAARTHRPHRKSPRGGEARRDFMAPRGVPSPGCPRRCRGSSLTRNRDRAQDDMRNRTPIRPVKRTIRPTPTRRESTPKADPLPRTS